MAFLPMFGIGGLTGLPLGLAPSDIHLHDTYYVIGHFHYVVAPGTIFAIFAGIYYWFPKITGRQMSELLGVSRRLWDGGQQYAHAQDTLQWNTFMSISAWLLLVAQIPFIINLFVSIKKGVKVGANPWEATTLEWSAAPSPPIAHGNFPQVPVVTCGPYEYSPPGTDKSFLPQDAAGQEA